VSQARLALGRERATAIGRLAAGWGDPIIVRDRIWPLSDCAILVVGDMDGAAAVSHAEWPVAELVVIEAFTRGAGIGQTLLNACFTACAGCRTLRVCTTNDNLIALAFYQRQGFRLTAIRPGAVDEARKRKPQIPPTGENGLPIRDEIDLELELQTVASAGN
jgi:GNAT superfamily N-acetyltransferase